MILFLLLFVFVFILVTIQLQISLKKKRDAKTNQPYSPIMQDSLPEVITKVIMRLSLNHYNLSILMDNGMIRSLPILEV